MANGSDTVAAVLKGVLWVARGLGLVLAGFVGFFALAYTLSTSPARGRARREGGDGE
jgi:hypothetical protein